jgi:hypothetical protein
MREAEAVELVRFRIEMDVKKAKNANKYYI